MTQPPHRSTLVAALILAAMLAPRPATAAEGDLLIRAGTVYTMAGEPLSPGAVLVRDGKVAEVAGTIDATEDVEVIDLGDGASLIPGLVDADLPAGVEGPTAEITREVTPRFNPLPAVDRSSRRFLEALAGGTTSGALLPSSENVVPGLAPVLKTSGDEVVAAEAATVITVASDPADRNRARNRPDSIYVRQPTNRMGVVSVLRNAFARASQIEPESESLGGDAALVPLREALEGARPIVGLSRTEYDLLTLIRLAREFGFRPVAIGGQEGYKVAEELAEAKLPVILGPLRTAGNYGPERSELAWNTAGVLHEAGVPVALSGGDLLDQARFAARFGLPEAAALAAITSEPARLLGVDGRVGTIEPGKDADLVALDGPPLEFTSAVRWVMVGGALRTFDDPQHED